MPFMSESRRPAVRPPRLRLLRPSVLDATLQREPFIAACCCNPDLLVLYVENRPVSLIPSTPLDQVTLEARLLYLRSHYPRQTLPPPISRRKPRRRSRSLS
jgi:hypothetical protein